MTPVLGAWGCVRGKQGVVVVGEDRKSRRGRGGPWGGASQVKSSQVKLSQARTKTKACQYVRVCECAWWQGVDGSHNVDVDKAREEVVVGQS